MASNAIDTAQAEQNMQSMSMVATAGFDPKTNIIIGDREYSVPLSKFPNLASFVRNQHAAQPFMNKFVHGPINHFDVALKGVELGYRHCFRMLPANLPAYRTLFKSYDLLGVDILDGLSILDVLAHLRADEPLLGHIGYDKPLVPEYRDAAQDAAFRFLYVLVCAPFWEASYHAKQLAEAARYVRNSDGTFDPGMKLLVQEAFESPFELTISQMLCW